MYSKSQRGFSFVEVLFVTTILTFITTGAMSLVSRGHRGGSKDKADPEFLERGRAAVGQMVRELGMAGYPAPAADPLLADITSANSNLVADCFLVTAPTQVIFEADLDDDGVVERVEYRLNGAALERSAVSKNSDGTVSRANYEVIAGEVDSGEMALFTYTAEQDRSLRNPGDIRLVHISLGLRVPYTGREKRRYQIVRFEGDAYRRNPEPWGIGTAALINAGGF